MIEDRLTRRALITILLSGLLTGVVALVGVGASGVLPAQVFRAQTVVLISPAADVSYGDKNGLWTALEGGTQSQIAAALFAQPKYRDLAAVAAGVAPNQLSVTAGVVESSVLINIKVDAPTAAVAETVADKIVELARPDIAGTVGKFQVNAVQPATGTATPAGIPAGQALVVVFIGGLVIGSGFAFVAIRARRRKQDVAAYDSGSFPLPTPPRPRPPQRSAGPARRPDGSPPRPRRPPGT
ncbi:hypothetical protein [Pseudonocardia sp. TRM90224]|uniref:hypothetical protein n=1 Tax=Pseudonocardia sp. TRM90224 TaxID=2812678 RepID=UPI001E4F7D3D|nr:hypothetical protein [Pseudonocardia sp. TRM90224]